MKIFSCLVFCASVGMMWAGPGASSSPPLARHSEYPASISNTSSKEFLGREVYSKSGEKLGKVEDLAINQETGFPEYALLSGPADTFKPVPISAVQRSHKISTRRHVLQGNSGIARIHDGGRVRRVMVVPEDPIFTRGASSETILSLAIEASEFDAAPGIHRSQMAQLATSARQQQIAAFYGISRAETTSIAANTSLPPETLTPTGRAESQRTTKPERFSSTREVVGKILYSTQGEEIGKVIDLLIDLEGKQEAYAIVSVSNFIEPIKRRYAIALSALESEARRDGVTFQGNWRTLDNAPSWDKRLNLDGESLKDTTIFKY